jgi:hypothetical protein
VRVVAVACLLVTGCSSSKASDTRSSGSADTSATAVQQYLAAVNTLCDDLLPKVLQVIKGGHPDVYPVAEFFAELPAHSQLLSGFDSQLSEVAVPPAARMKSAALAAYIRFANQLDAKRLAAAKQGQAAFDREIGAEKVTAADDPTIAARDAAGFNESCSAR